MNKPVAEIVWAGGIEDSIKDVKFYKVPSPDVGTKLYASPVKELTLTDEDILEEWTCKYSDCYQDTLIDFAKAILRKAQEK